MLKQTLGILLLFITFSSCTVDREIKSDLIENPNLELIHYWNFNDASTLTTLVKPNQTTGGTSFTYLGAFFDEVTPGTDLNTKLASEAGSALRLRNPAGDCIIKMPTLGYKDVVLTYAVMRTGSGAQQQTISYSINGTDFTSDGLTTSQIGISENFIINQFNFAGIPGITNNENFKIKISFSNGSENTSGNNRIDNLSLEGIPSGDPIPDPNAQLLLHYWNFNSLPTGTLTNPVVADVSLLTSLSPKIEYVGTGTGFVDQFTPGTDLNARNGDVSGLGIRFRNPSDTRSIIITAPTSGYKDIIAKFATFRTSSGAQTQNYSYSIDGINYITTNLALTTFDAPLEPNFELVTLNLSSISGANNNPNFKIKISFSGTQASGTSGNNRFDNLTIEAKIN